MSPTARRPATLPVLIVASAMVVWTSGCTTEEVEVAEIVPEDVGADATLLVATDPTFPPAQFRAPLEFQDVQRGEFTGFEVDLVEAVAADLGLNVAWVDLPFDEVLAQVESGEAEMGAAAITITEERRQDLAFVPFFSTGTQWTAREPNAAGVTPNNACGERVAVQTGTIQADDLAQRSQACQAAGEDPIEILEYQRQDEVTAALVAGVADAFLADAPAVSWAIQQSGGSPSAAGTVDTGRLIEVGERYDEAPYGWAVADAALAEALLQGLRAVVDSGDYAEILDFWGVSEGALEVDELDVVGLAGAG